LFLKAIAEALDVSADELVNAEGLRLVRRVDAGTAS
jgi:hypothetical protein